MGWERNGANFGLIGERLAYLKLRLRLDKMGQSMRKPQFENVIFDAIFYVGGPRG